MPHGLLTYLRYADADVGLRLGEAGGVVVEVADADRHLASGGVGRVS